MAQHNQILDTVDDCISDGVKRQILHLTTDDYQADGRTLQIGGRELINFASYSYMGLETDIRLKEGAIRAVERYGSQFGTTRAYASNYLYGELEANMSEIFGKPAIVAPSTTLAHQAAIPVLVRDDDAVILDQFVHASVQVTVKMVKAKGIPVELLRHNNLEKLEERVKELSLKHRRVWYMLDGVYSMYGDYAPLKELKQLMDKYEHFYCYIDDTHGISWTGKNGSGFALDQIDYHPQMILVSCMNKAFASAGGVIVLPDSETKRKIRTCGDTLIFSGSVPPPMLGVGLASSHIHLSDEIYQMQEELNTRVNYCNALIKKHQLPLIAENEAPIFFIGMSLPKVGHNMVKRLMNEGYYVSIGQFPAVSMRCAGLRMCVTRHQKLEDIESMVEAIAYHYPKVLETEGQNDDSVRKAFKIPLLKEERNDTRVEFNMGVEVVHLTSIADIDQGDWDAMFGERGSFDWNGLLFLEKCFAANTQPEDNWAFHYILVKDENKKIIAATFYTVALCKDDMFSPAAVSSVIEEQRRTDKYHLCSKVVMMGSLLTEGNHLYLDMESENWKSAALAIIEWGTIIQESEGANSIIIRDLENVDSNLAKCFLGEGFVKVDLPETHIVEDQFLKWTDEAEYLSLLPYKARHNIRRDVLRYEDYFDVETINEASQVELDHLYSLYKSVKNRSFELNTFSLSKSVFAAMIKDARWEVVGLYLKDQYADRKTGLPVAVGFVYLGEKVSCPMIVGIDYRYLYTYKNYKQIIYQVIKRARIKGMSKVYLGFTASTEKKKYGARAIQKVAYVRTNDAFNMQVLELDKDITKPVKVVEEEFAEEAV